MSDAITELRRLRAIVARREASKYFSAEYRQACDQIMSDDIDDRIAELEAAQQAEPSDAEIEAWMDGAVRGSKHSGCIYTITQDELVGAVALMRRGRGDAKLREAAAALSAQLRVVHDDSRYIGVWQMAQMRCGSYSGPQYAEELAALRAALGE